MKKLEYNTLYKLCNEYEHSSKIYHNLTIELLSVIGKSMEAQDKVDIMHEKIIYAQKQAQFKDCLKK